MNKTCYRTVFNKARGLLMAVAETVAGQGKACGESPLQTASPASVRASLRTAAVHALTFSVWTALGMVLYPVVHAQIVADPNAPANQRPAITTAPNGVPLVNIQTPSAAGVSRNTYSQFDVNAQGAILNNARTNAQTQLGGWVQANPWLAGGAARVILNEINSSNPSQLRGAKRPGQHQRRGPGQRPDRFHRHCCPSLGSQRRYLGQRTQGHHGREPGECGANHCHTHRRKRDGTHFCA